MANELVPLDADGDIALPVVNLLTGRGFITGKSGAGKSSTASVIAEELLDRGFPLLIVDTDGEYWGLKEQYEILHVGADEECDLQVGPEHGEKLAEFALEENVPIILDVSGYLEESEAKELIFETTRHLFAKEKKLEKPFLVLVEEVHEYIPEGGGVDETGQMLIKIGKRGRKRGLGLVGISQRPADVQKDFISQANWICWHRLTWDNDTAVVRRVVDAEHADAVSGLGDGEMFLQADFLDADIQRVQVRPKQTFDAAATPDLEDIERPELKSVSGDLVGELESISERQRRRLDRVEQLEQRLERKDERIEELEGELERARDVQGLAEQFTDAMTAAATEGDTEAAQTIKAEVMEVRQEKRELETKYEDVVQERDNLAERVNELEAELEDREAADDLRNLRDELDELIERHADVLAIDEDDERLRERVRNLEAENERLQREVKNSRPSTSTSPTEDQLARAIKHDAVQAALDIAKENGRYDARHFDRVMAVLASAENGGPLTAEEVAPMTDISVTSIREVLKELYTTGLVTKDTKDQAAAYALDREFLERRIEVAELEAVS